MSEMPSAPETLLEFPCAFPIKIMGLTHDALAQTADLLNPPLDELYARLGLPADYPSALSLKDAAADMGMGLSDFKHQLFD